MFIAEMGKQCLSKRQIMGDLFNAMFRGVAKQWLFSQGFWDVFF